ncbi:hypothetical protein H8K52_11250 [Undibacterium seohonense]|jgi:hypothetical protein|uniref:Uncharacterized protein n=1 Tax=Undibacterium seohonense TaxID=1344950 RepID=A0ABR6X4W8_9BURK|nr:hypothetical protein [Undibacterium seohonense]MBC3807921.1 hypothetical protein [Undibacterium seohonense]
MLTGIFAQDVKAKLPFSTGTDSWSQPFIASWPALQVANTPNLASSPLTFSPSMGASALLTPHDGSTGDHSTWTKQHSPN